MEHHLDNSTFVSCLMYTQATLKKVLLNFYIRVQSIKVQTRDPRTGRSVGLDGETLGNPRPIRISAKNVQILVSLDRIRVSVVLWIKSWRPKK